ncbi:SsgA family sporulation/cell division regulator [Streptomyces sp. NPDC050549]|uniref:SsgA family sporulation/cell division regulator n=1 Tax=Streptomyces sp. NPDC050549 TaxID=3155406 RepID=UPI00343719FE
MSGGLVRRRVAAALVVAAEELHPVAVDLEFDVCDPFAVRLVFRPDGEREVTWCFARDLLAGGVQYPCGEGDVRVIPIAWGEPGRVVIRLRGADGEAAVSFPALPLVSFLGRTHALAPLGLEHHSPCYRLHLDRALDDLLTAW